jgi:hypothetical protein
MAFTRSSALFVASILAVLALMLSGTAVAAPPYRLVTAWGSYGTANGQFVGPTAIASGPAAGIYVGDSDGRVQAFDRAGGFTRKWTAPGMRTLVANQPAGYVFAYDGTTVSVFDSAGQLVNQFNPHIDDGTPISGAIGADSGDSISIAFTWPYAPEGSLHTFNHDGIDWSGYPLNCTSCWHGYALDLAVDPTGPEDDAVDVAVYGHVDVITLRGDANREVPTTGSGPIAVDGSGHLFRVDAAAHDVQVFDANGESLGRFGAESLASPSDVTVDTDGNVYVSDKGSHRIVKFAPGTAVSPQSIDFGSQPVATASTPRTVTLTNLAADALTLGQVALVGGQPASFPTGADTCSGSTLASGEACSVAVSFAPRAIGSRTTSLRFTDAAGNLSQAVALSGIGTSAVALSPQSITFADRPDHTQSSARTVTLTNVGGTALTVSGVALSGTDASSFLTRSDTCTGKTLATGQSCSAQVRFRPLGTGVKTARLRFTDSAADSPQSVALSGTGTPGPWLERSVQALKFGRIAVGTTAPAQSVTLTNVGSASLTIGGLTVEGANPGDFPGPTGTCTAPSTLAPSESCMASLAFRPSATGSRSATLTIADSAPRNPHHVGLQGTGN